MQSLKDYLNGLADRDYSQINSEDWNTSTEGWSALLEEYDTMLEQLKNEPDFTSYVEVNKIVSNYVSDFSKGMLPFEGRMRIHHPIMFYNHMSYKSCQMIFEDRRKELAAGECDCKLRNGYGQRPDSTHFEKIYEGEIDLYSMGEHYTVYRCPDCDFHWVFVFQSYATHHDSYWAKWDEEKYPISRKLYESSFQGEASAAGKKGRLAKVGEWLRRFMTGDWE